MMKTILLGFVLLIFNSYNEATLDGDSNYQNPDDGSLRVADPENEPSQMRKWMNDEPHNREMDTISALARQIASRRQSTGGTIHLLAVMTGNDECPDSSDIIKNISIPSKDISLTRKHSKYKKLLQENTNNIYCGFVHENRLLNSTGRRNKISIHNWNCVVDSAMEDNKLVMQVEMLKGFTKLVHSLKVDIYRLKSDEYCRDGNYTGYKMIVLHQGSGSTVISYNDSFSFCAVMTPIYQHCEKMTCICSEHSCERIALFQLATRQGRKPVVEIDNTTHTLEIFFGCMGFLVIVLIITLHLYRINRRNIKCFRGFTDYEDSLEKQLLVDRFSKEPTSYPVIPLPIVILYSQLYQETVSFVGELKQFLQTHLSCQIFDHREESQFQDFSTKGTAWLSSILEKDHVRIILVACPEVIRHERVRVRNEEAPNLDQHLTHHLKLVDHFLLSAKNPYGNVIVIRSEEMLAKNPEIQQVLYWTPFIVYTFPRHNNMLLCHLQGRNASLSDTVAECGHEENPSHTTCTQTTIVRCPTGTISL